MPLEVTEFSVPLEGSFEGLSEVAD